MVTRYETVDAYLQEQPAHRQELIKALRETVLGTRPCVTEIIKWNSPSYVYEGEDRVTVNASSQDAVRLILHAGVSTTEDKQAAPTFAGDPNGLLHWHSNIRASLAVADAEQARSQEDAIAEVVGNWLDAFA
jgi:hypothetical protein